MNSLNASGGIGKDAELRYTPNQDAVCSFSLALSSGFGDKKVTTWLNCNVWGKRAETLAPMLLKGTTVGIVGELTNRPYKAKDGTEKFSLEVRVNDLTLYGKKGDTNTLPNEYNVPKTLKTASSVNYDSSKTMHSNELEEDLPFN
jgi:single-strand DNA-binding protein